MKVYNKTIIDWLLEQTQFCSILELICCPQHANLANKSILGSNETAVVFDPSQKLYFDTYINNTYINNICIDERRREIMLMNMHTIWLHTHKQLKPDLKLDSAFTEIHGQID